MHGEVRHDLADHATEFVAVPAEACGNRHCRRVRKGGRKVAHAQLRHLNPLPRNTGEVLRRYEKVLVPEMNLGQLLKLVRAEFLVDAVGYNRVSGLPLRQVEVAAAIEALVDQ